VVRGDLPLRKRKRIIASPRVHLDAATFGREPIFLAQGVSPTWNGQLPGVLTADFVSGFFSVVPARHIFQPAAMVPHFLKRR